MTNKQTDEKYITESKAEVLESLEGNVKEWIDNHLSKRKIWFSSDFLPSDEKNDSDKENIVLQLRNRVSVLVQREMEFWYN